MVGPSKMAPIPEEQAERHATRPTLTSSGQSLQSIATSVESIGSPIDADVCPYPHGRHSSLPEGNNADQNCCSRLQRPMTMRKGPCVSRCFAATSILTLPARSHYVRGATVSVTSNVWKFDKENGRTYHGYRSGGSYCLPYPP